MTDLILAHKDVQMSLTVAEQRRVSVLLGGGATQQQVADAAAGSLQKIIDAGDDVPLLSDVDVLVLQHLLGEQAVAVDRNALTALLDAWRQAEMGLKPAVRVAVRLTDRVLQAVLSVKSREDFAAWFARDVAKRLTDEQGKFLQAYLDELANWTALGRADVSETPHYLEHVMSDIFSRRILAAKGGRKTALRRLKFAREAVQDCLFT